MSSEISVLVDDLVSAGGRLDSVGEQLREVLRNLVSAIDAEGACWGGDESGASFAEHYQPAAAAALESAQSLVTDIENAGRGAVQTAHALDDADALNASPLRSIGAEMGDR